MKSAEKIISEFNLTAILVTHNLKDAWRMETESSRWMRV